MPTDTQINAQLAASLGAAGGGTDTYVQQLYCFHDKSFERFLAANNSFSAGIIGASSDPKKLQYPYIEGGDRDCSISTAGFRHTIFDTSCLWSLTLDGTQSPFTLHDGPSAKSPVNGLVTIKIKCTISAKLHNPEKVSAELKTAYHLTDVDLTNWRALLWTVGLVPSAIDNDATNSEIHANINRVFQDFFTKNELSTLFVPVSSFNTYEEWNLSEDEYDKILNGDKSIFQSKVGIAIAPSEDTDHKDKSNNIYIVVEQLPPSFVINRSGPSAPYIQQWRIPKEAVDNVTVLSRYELFTSVLSSLNQPPDLTQMDTLVAGWPPVGGVYHGVTIQNPTHDWKIWDFDKGRGDFNWIPGPDPDKENQKKCSNGSAVGTSYGTAFDSNVTQYNQGSALEYDQLTRHVENRLYYTPGYTDKHGKDHGPRLPMQDGDTTQSNKPKWSLCLIGKTNLTPVSSILAEGGNWDWSAEFEVFWRVYFSFTGFVKGKTALGVSDVIVENQYITGDADDRAFLSSSIQKEAKGFQQWLQQTHFKAAIENTVRSRLQLYMPVARQINVETCYFNNNGDLLVPFAYGSF